MCGDLRSEIHFEPEILIGSKILIGSEIHNDQKSILDEKSTFRSALTGITGFFQTFRQCRLFLATYIVHRNM